MAPAGFRKEGKMLKKCVQAGSGKQKADLVFKNAGIVNVFTEELEQGDVAVCDGIIVGIGSYEGADEVDCTGKFLVPGLIDGHIHLESSMMQPAEFVRTVLPHGTTALVTDPHEIANVCGREGIDYMYKATRGLPLEVYFTLPSCVPAAPLDESGACLEAEDLRAYYQEKRVVGLAEMMNYVGTTAGDSQILQKIEDARHFGKVVDGHAPGLTGNDLCAYISAGVHSDHECSTSREAAERIRRGQWIMVREGTAARNLEALMPMFEYPYCERAMLVTDDKHPGDLLENGHIDAIIRKAVRLGADPCKAVKMGSFNAAVYFGLRQMGAVAPGYQADLVLLSDLEEFRVEAVYKKGTLAVREGKALPFAAPSVNQKLSERVYHSFNMKKLEEEDFLLSVHKKKKEGHIRVITLQNGQILTGEEILPYTSQQDGVNVRDDIIKLAVLERHHRTGHRGLGYLKGYGLKKGAVASSVAHDSHNLIVAGTNARDMALAANCVREIQGGWALVADGQILAQLPLPVAGLMSDLDAQTLAERIRLMKERAHELGVGRGIDPFMTLAFVSLPVIPALRLTTSGLVDTQTQKIVPVFL
jgi:adenine deaminase